MSNLIQKKWVSLGALGLLSTYFTGPHHGFMDFTKERFRECGNCAKLNVSFKHVKECFANV